MGSSRPTKQESETTKRSSRWYCGHSNVGCWRAHRISHHLDSGIKREDSFAKVVVPEVALLSSQQCILLARFELHHAGAAVHVTDNHGPTPSSELGPAKLTLGHATVCKAPPIFHDGC